MDQAMDGRLEAGVDEAGRGPLVGSVFAAAVILPPDYDLAGLADSKKLSEKKRDALPEHRAGFAPVRELLAQGRLFE